MSQLKQILEGWTNLALKELNLLNVNVTEAAAAKYAHCLQCPSLSQRSKKCVQCGCYMPAKILTNAKCPLKKF